MPKTAVNKNHSFILWQDYVRFSREVLSIDSEPKTMAVNKRSNMQFRPSILATYLRHIVAADFLVMHVRHISLSSNLHGLARRELYGF